MFGYAKFGPIAYRGRRALNAPSADKVEGAMTRGTAGNGCFRRTLRSASTTYGSHVFPLWGCAPTITDAEFHSKPSMAKAPTWRRGPPEPIGIHPQHTTVVVLCISYIRGQPRHFLQAPAIRLRSPLLATSLLDSSKASRAALPKKFPPAIVAPRPAIQQTIRSSASATRQDSQQFLAFTAGRHISPPLPSPGFSAKTLRQAISE